MTTEAAVAKLYYLFSCGYDKEKDPSRRWRRISAARSAFLKRFERFLRVNVAQLCLRRFKEQQII